MSSVMAANNGEVSLSPGSAAVSIMKTI